MTEGPFSSFRTKEPGSISERVPKLTTSSNPSNHFSGSILTPERSTETTNTILRQMQRLHIRTPETTGNLENMAESWPKNIIRRPSSNDILTPPTTPSTSRPKVEDSFTSRRSSNQIPTLNFNLDLTHAEFLGSGVWSNVYKVTSLPLPLEPNADTLTPPSTPQTKSTFHIPKAYAVKSATRPDSHDVFTHEAKILTQIQGHENSSTYVIPFYGILPTSSLLFHCAEHGTLETLTTNSASISATEVLHTFLTLAPQLTCGLSFLHAANIIHADIKPANILLDHSAGKLIARYADFSASFLATSTPPTLSGGTWAYMAPEQLSLDITLNTPTFASDVYALGVTLISYLCGDSPFVGVQGNGFRLREAVKMGDVVGWIGGEDGFVRRLCGVERVWRDGGGKGEVFDCVRGAVAKKREKRMTAGEWKEQMGDMVGGVRGALGVGLGIGCLE